MSDKNALGYLGPEGSNSHEVALAIKKSDEQLRQFSSAELAKAIREESITRAVLPIENSCEGRVRWVLDLFSASELNGFAVVAEAVLRVRHCLVGYGEKDEVQVVSSHPQALGQCRRFLGNLKTCDTDSTSGAVAQVAQLRDRRHAAIGTRRAAEMYNVPIICENVGDRDDIKTRFVVLGKEKPRPTGNDKTTMMFGVNDEPGALCRVLGVFFAVNIDMSMILSEQSPSKRLGEYIFFVDVCGHESAGVLPAAIEMIKLNTISLKVFGSYPWASSVIGEETSVSEQGGVA